MSKASEESLSQLHKAVADALSSSLQSEDPEERTRALTAAIRFLKDNSITADLKNSKLEELARTRPPAPSDEELRELARMTPDDFQKLGEKKRLT